MNTLSTRLITIWLVLIVALGYININIFGKERIIRDGQTVLLELRPVDPRSLMQGDYMILDYDIARQVGREIYPDWNNESQYPQKGAIVIQLDDNNVASFVRFHDSDGVLGENERLLAYDDGRNALRWWGNMSWQSVSFGADNYFFQEGTADLFEEARYGELRVQEDGTAILIGLIDENLEQIVAP